MTLATDDIGHHISAQFNDDLQNLHRAVLRMGRLAATQIVDAIAALEEHDIALAELVVRRDGEVDELEKSIDQECTRILVRRQPAASDLRLIFAVIKTVTDLERIGDMAERVALTVLEHPGRARDRLRSPIGHMGSLVLALLNKALDAFARMDVHTALEVGREDDAVDQEYHSVTRQLVSYMMEDPRCISWAMHLSWAARALERIGDHAKNIAEYVVYMVHGKDVRHTSRDERERSAQGSADAEP